MDIAAFKISHSVDDKTPPPCEPKVARNVPSGRWRTCQGRFKMQTLTTACQNHEHAHSSRSVKGQFKGRWMKVQGKGRRQAHIRAVLSWILQPSKLATPSEET